MTDGTLPRHIIRLAGMPSRKPARMRLEPTAAERAAVATALAIPAVEALRLIGELRPMGRSDWQLDAQLEATVVQECVATLEPVRTELSEPVRRSFVAELPEPDATEVEMPEDDSVEPLPASLDLGQVLIEALALALPLYPRAEGAAEVEVAVAAPGVRPLTADDLKPFAGLAALRRGGSEDEAEEDGER